SKVAQIATVGAVEGHFTALWSAPVDHAGARTLLVQPPLQVQTLEDELDSRCDFGRRGATGRPAVGPIATVERTKLPDGVGEAGHFAHPADVLAGRYPLAGLHHEAAFERGYDLVQVVQREPLVEGREERLCDQSLDDALLGRFIADRFELDLAGC